MLALAINCVRYQNLIHELPQLNINGIATPTPSGFVLLKGYYFMCNSVCLYVSLLTGASRARERQRIPWSKSQKVVSNHVGAGK